jgi:hypothetical protein
LSVCHGAHVDPDGNWKGGRYIRWGGRVLPKWCVREFGQKSRKIRDKELS